MLIHVVKPGDTVYSIALEYGIPMSQLILDNGLETSSRLAVGQALVVQFPTQTHTVQPGETLASIAAAYQLPLRQLYRNNPILGGIPELYPGQTLVLAYDSTPEATLSVNGYAYPFIDPALLQSAVPYLTYLTPFTYGFTPDGTLVELDDEALLAAARQGGAAPLMHLSTLTEEGGFSNELAHLALTQPAVQDTLVDNLEAMLVQKGYRGLDVDFEYVNPEYADDYVSFAAQLRERTQELGIPLIIALAPKTYADQPGILYEGHNYRALGEQADAVLLMTYEWGYSYGPPMAVSPLQAVRSVLDYAVTEIPPEKIFMGFPNYAYDWPLPFEAGSGRARVISHEMAVEMAVRYRVEIQYDEASATPYFFYQSEDGRVHEVWFEDARSTQAKLLLIQEYGLRGVGYWNDMRSFVQGFSVQNALYTLQRL